MFGVVLVGGRHNHPGAAEADAEEDVEHGAAEACCSVFGGGVVSMYIERSEEREKGVAQRHPKRQRLGGTCEGRKRKERKRGKGRGETWGKKERKEAR